MVFTEINEYPEHMMGNIVRQELQKRTSNEVKPDNRETHKMQTMLPYGATKCNKLIRKMKKRLKKSLSSNIKTIVTYQSKMLSTKFHVKDKTNLSW